MITGGAYDMEQLLSPDIVIFGHLYLQNDPVMDGDCNEKVNKKAMLQYRLFLLSFKTSLIFSNWL
jgi:hypothetical protein